MTHVQGYSMHHFCKNERPESIQMSFSVALIKETIVYPCNGPYAVQRKKENRMRKPYATMESQRLSEKKQHTEHWISFINVAYVEKASGVKVYSNLLV